MATNTAGGQARELPFQAVHYLRRTVNYNDGAISTGVKVGRLPAGASVLFTNVKIKTAFNAVTTNVLTVGQNSSSYNDMVNASDIDETATGSSMVVRGADLTLATEVDVYAKYTQTGTAATAGVAEIIVAYCANNDQ